MPGKKRNDSNQAVPQKDVLFFYQKLKIPKMKKRQPMLIAH